jgi:hypothetical protein
MTSVYSLSHKQREHLNEVFAGISDSVSENFETCDMYEDCGSKKEAKALFKKYKASSDSDVKLCIQAFFGLADVKSVTDTNLGMMADVVQTAFDESEYDDKMFKKGELPFLCEAVLLLVQHDCVKDCVRKMKEALEDFEV